MHNHDLKTKLSCNIFHDSQKKWMQRVGSHHPLWLSMSILLSQSATNTSKLSSLLPSAAATVCILTEVFSSRQTCLPCDLSDCSQECKHIQTVSHHHLTLQSPLVLPATVIFLYFATVPPAPASVCFAIAFITKTPSSRLLHLRHLSLSFANQTSSLVMHACFKGVLQRN